LIRIAADIRRSEGRLRGRDRLRRGRLQIAEPLRAVGRASGDIRRVVGCGLIDAVGEGGVRRRDIDGCKLRLRLIGRQPRPRCPDRG